MNPINKLRVSVIIPVYNVETVIEKVLTSLIGQSYPIEEIILIDNCSTDKSVKIVESFIRKHKKKNFRLIRREKMYGIGSSYNLGFKLAKTPYVVTLHSDSMIAGNRELEKLIAPIIRDPLVVASYPTLYHPRKIWLKYNFWQKCQFGRVVGTKAPSMNGKFDCLSKKAIKQIDGYNIKRFTKDIGTEDADINYRLKKIGKVIATDATVIHLHGLDPSYSLRSWIENRRFLSFSYGALLRYHFSDEGMNAVLFLIKPGLVLSLLFIFVNPLFIIPYLIFPFLYMRRMFVDSSTRFKTQNIFLPFIIYFLIFYETYWVIKGLTLRVRTI